MKHLHSYSHDRLANKNLNVAHWQVEGRKQLSDRSLMMSLHQIVHQSRYLGTQGHKARMNGPTREAKFILSNNVRY